MLNDHKIAEAVAEAKRFIKVAELAGTEQITEYLPVHPNDPRGKWEHHTSMGTTPQTRARIERSRLDLVRMLGELGRRG